MLLLLMGYVVVLLELLLFVLRYAPLDLLVGYGTVR